MDVQVIAGWLATRERGSSAYAAYCGGADHGNENRRTAPVNQELGCCAIGAMLIMASSLLEVFNGEDTDRLPIPHP